MYKWLFRGFLEHQKIVQLEDEESSFALFMSGILLQQLQSMN